MSKILRNEIVDPSDVDPIEVLAALHKRIVQVEKLQRELRVHMSNFELDIESLTERVNKLEENGRTE